MSDINSITRRTFIATGVAAGLSSVVNAQQTSSRNGYLDAILKWSRKEIIGDLDYIQIHSAAHIDFNTALYIAEQLAADHRLTKVSAVGELDLANRPTDVMAGLYYERNLRATISSLPSSRDFFGTVLGTMGTIRLYTQRITLLDKNGETSDSATVSPSIIREETMALTHVIKALSEGKTIQI
jgi:hypothetical protein